MKKIKIPQNSKIYIIFFKKEKYILIENIITKKIFYLKVPMLLKLKKDNNFIYTETNIEKIYAFNTILETFFNFYNVPVKKTLLKRGLGFKITYQDNSLLVFKLGYSHLITLSINASKFNVVIGKNYISILSLYKSEVGNLCEKIFRLKKMDSYKGRGMFIKNKNFIFKLIKKS